MARWKLTLHALRQCFKNNSFSFEVTQDFLWDSSWDGKCKRINENDTSVNTLKGFSILVWLPLKTVMLAYSKN